MASLRPEDEAALVELPAIICTSCGKVLGQYAQLVRDFRRKNGPDVSLSSLFNAFGIKKTCCRAAMANSGGRPKGQIYFTPRHSGQVRVDSRSTESLAERLNIRNSGLGPEHKVSLSYLSHGSGAGPIGNVTPASISDPVQLTVTASTTLHKDRAGFEEISIPIGIGLNRVNKDDEVIDGILVKDAVPSTVDQSLLTSNRSDVPRSEPAATADSAAVTTSMLGMSLVDLLGDTVQTPPPQTVDQPEEQSVSTIDQSEEQSESTFNQHETQSILQLAQKSLAYGSLQPIVIKESNGHISHRYLNV